MKDIELLLPRVLEKAPMCPEPTAIRHIRDAAIEFCRRTRIWRVQDIFALTAEACEALAVYPGTHIFEITHAAWLAPGSGDQDRGIPLVPVTMDWLDKYRAGWRSEQSIPSWITQIAPNSVRLAPKPEPSDDGYGSLRLELILVPSQDADQVPDILVDAYPLEIADGALARLLALPAEFGNPQLATAHAQAFADHLGRWSDRVQRGQQRALRRTRPSQYF